MKKRKNLFIFAVCLGLSIVCLCIMKENTLVSVQTSSTTLSNKSIGWGIKRAKNHEQPDLGSENKKLIDEFNRNCNGK